MARQQRITYVHTLAGPDPAQAPPAERPPVTTPEADPDTPPGISDPALVTSHNPADPTDVLIELDGCGPETVLPVIEQAHSAQRSWAAAGPQAHASALRQAGDAIEAAAATLTVLIVRETGKPFTQARAEVAATAATWRHYAHLASAPEEVAPDAPTGTGLMITRRRPYGVAGLITPWNSPLAAPSQKAAPALAAGNAVVLNPAPAATACALRLAELLADALPHGVLQVLPGGTRVAEQIAASTDVVSFTGSAAARSTVIRATADQGTPVHTEAAGYHNTALVLPDADIAQAARDIAQAIAGHAGQHRTATRQVITVGPAHAALRSALAQALQALPASDPASRTTVCGPLISSAARNRVAQERHSAAAAGARVLTGTGAGASQRTGWYLDPILLEASPQNDPLRGAEISGPIAVLHQAQDMAHAMHLADSGPRGLVTSLHTGDLDAALHAAERLRSPSIQFNAPTTQGRPTAHLTGEEPTGLQTSGTGCAALDFFTRTGTVWLQSPQRRTRRRPSTGVQVS